MQLAKHALKLMRLHIDLRRNNTIVTNDVGYFNERDVLRVFDSCTPGMLKVVVELIFKKVHFSLVSFELSDKEVSDKSEEIRLECALFVWSTSELVHLPVF